MAIQIKYYNQDLDITIYNAYWRINPNYGIIGGKNNINYTIEVFKNADLAHVENFKTIQGFTFSFTPNLNNGAPNLIAQAYNHAKTLPQFIDGIDV